MRAPDALFDRYVATGAALWADALMTAGGDPAGGVPEMLVEKWGCPDAVAAYVGERLPEVLLKLSLGAIEPCEDPTSYTSEKLVQLLAARYREVASRADDPERALVDQLIAATSLYDTRETVQELVDFIARVRIFAPFNAMLLHIQKPGLTHAASARDWWNRFGRVPKRGARPLLILRTMGPIDFVFDILDTEGDPVPDGAFTFPALGCLTETHFEIVLRSIASKGVVIVPYDAGDADAGWIIVLERSTSKKARHSYKLGCNKRHPTTTRFVTIAHELAHLFLGHLGADPARRVTDRRHKPHDVREVEAETVAYIVAKRNGLTPRSESYLTAYSGALADLDLPTITRAANAVETSMGLSAQTTWNAQGCRGGLNV
ncbi:MAG: ImmA/IrrE family metallo-endopeptidase [Salinarimonas sp.]